MPMLPVAAYPTPTKEQYAVVKKVYEATGILTVKDKVTSSWVPAQKRCGDVPWESPFAHTPEYGHRYNPKELEAARIYEARGFSGQQGAVGLTGGGGYGRDTYYIRSFEVDLVGTPLLPQGIAVGGNEVWRRDVPLDIGGDDDGRTVKWYSDLSFEEMNRLRAWANEEKWVTDADIKASDKESAARRENKLATQQDPVGVIARALAHATQKPAAPAPEVAAAMAKAGVVWDAELGAWVLAKPTAGAAPK